MREPRTPEQLERDVYELRCVVACLLDALKWHLRGAEGTDQRSLDHGQQQFRRAFLSDRDGR